MIPGRPAGRARAFLVLVAAVFLYFHFRYPPKSLEDLDSINFALGVRHYDVAEHQPHPPGYPVFILAAKAVRAAAPSEPAALHAVSTLAGALGVFAIAAFFARVEIAGTSWTLAATLLAITAPMYWFTAARPLSDMAGLAAAVAVQALALSARSRRAVYAAAFAAGLAAGVRSQVAWLTLPLAIFLAVNRPDRKAPAFPVVALRAALAGLAFTAGVLVWFVPMVALTGGPSRYWRALTFQGSADFSDVQMLWTKHRPRDILDAFSYTFVAPWANWPIAAVVMVLAAAGFVWCLVRNRRALAIVGVAFGPYVAFHLLFQETFTARYALPIVVPIAFFAAAGARLLPWRLGLAGVAALVVFDAHVGGTSLAAYTADKAPAFRVLDDLAAAARAEPAPAVLAMDRRASFDFRRPIVWTGPAMPAFSAVLPAPPQHEWLEAVKYWTAGGRAPVWFVVDPKRAAIDLVQHGPPARYRWPLTHHALVGGARPDEVDVYRVASPEWFVGEGWALTPESAGVAEADRRGPAFGPIDAWIAPAALGGRIVIGGRNFLAAPSTLTLHADGAVVEAFDVQPGFFLRMVDAPRVAAASGYAHVTVSAPPDSRTAIEQFDASATRPIFGFGDGWYEHEFDPRLGVRWRWLSERGDLRFAAATPASMTLHVEGESPRKYYDRGSKLTVTAGGTVVFDAVLADDFSIDVPIPAGTGVVTLATDQVHVPAERGGLRRSPDRRRLGLRIFSCAVSAPGTGASSRTAR